MIADDSEPALSTTDALVGDKNTITSLRDSAVLINAAATVALPGPEINSDTSTENLNNFGGAHVYYGTIDTDNMHENFHYAIMQNNRNVEYFQKVRMKIILSQPNFNLYRNNVLSSK